MFRAALIFIVFGLIVVGLLLYFLWKILGEIFDKKAASFSLFPPDLKAVLAENAANLVPWDDESFSLLSLKLPEKTAKSILKSGKSGQLTTIYQEPLAAWALRGSHSDGQLLVRAQGREFSYRLRPNEAQIAIDGQPFGIIAGRVLLDNAGRAAREAGHLENDRDLFIKNRRIATLVHPTDTKRVTPKALDGLAHGLDETETNWLMAVAFWHILKSGQ